MKINILDPGLKGKAGHHYDFDRKLARYLVDAGHDVHVYGHVAVDPEIAERIGSGAAVSRLFRAFPYDPSEGVDYYAGELVQFELQSSVLAEDLKAVRNADLWIWPSMRAQHLNACVRGGVKVPIVGCVHEDPGIDVRSVDAMVWRLALLWAHHTGLRHTIGAVEPELRHRFMSILPEARFALFPHPYDGPPIDQPKSELKRIGFFGQQRAEKGARLMSRLFDRLLPDGYEIVFQDSAGVPKQLEHPQITALDFVDDMTSYLRDCDLVVLPYDVAAYRIRGSGMLTACLSLGVPVVGPFGTIPGHTIEQFNVGPLFTQTRSEAIYAAIKVADQNYERYAANAFRAAHHWSKRHGVARYAEALLAFA